MTYRSPFTNDPEYARLYAEESLRADIGETLATLMHKRGVSKVRLAVRLGVSPKRIRRLLRDGDDVRLFAAAVHELGGSVRVIVADEDGR